ISKLTRLPDVSDLTIICENVKFDVHSALVYSQCAVLKTACTGNFKSRIYEMKDESEIIVGKMIDFFYKADYDETSGDSKNDMSALQLHARVFALADKYRVNDLKTLSASKYEANLRDFKPAEFLGSIPDVYNLTPEAVRTLRDIAKRTAREKLLECIISDREARKTYDKMKEYILGFILDIVDSYIEQPPVRCRNRFLGA
ncbi:hypothetical protein BGW36DRAFT_293635, partial [Talaromyces proteolyticus]